MKEQAGSDSATLQHWGEAVSVVKQSFAVSGPASHQEMAWPLSQSSLRKALTPTLSISSLLGFS